MSYKSWFSKHGEKHRVIVDKLKAKGFSKEGIVDYFCFDNMVSSEPDFCSLYAEKKKCHDVENLVCYLCACPLFRFNSTGIEKVGNKIVFSYCHVNSKFGNQGAFGDAIHQDCSKCIVPHSRKYALQNYNENWFYIMESCDIEDKNE
ncbi:MAG: hypothetical protein OEZ01_14145 [Candidatus Heimdallarchaeota archaeon]|nr:hypothetical protein [Candidatus Heimdallarchaeota archaeon]